MSEQKQNRTVMITGASSGIGQAVAREMHQRGWNVGLVARRAERLDQLAAELGSAGRLVATAAVDVADREAVASAANSFREQFGPIDLLIANAGIGRPDYLDPFSIDDIELMFRVNTLGVINCIAAVLPEMLNRGSGHLVAVSSAGAYKGMPGSAGYCASKAAVNTFMDGLRVHLREHQIDVTTICPGFVRTPMTDSNEFRMPWLLEPEDAARRMANAIERRRKVFNFPWQLTVPMRLLRWMPDWMIARFIPRKSNTPREVFEDDSPSITKAR